MQLRELYKRFRESEGISTDTRTLKKGELFIALSGENFDGNKYVPTAMDNGAHHIVCSDASYQEYDNVTVVSDALETLQKLANYHRKELNIPVVGLTGSNGKTTTKELIVSVLSQQYEVTATNGNFNNHIGVPLTLLLFNEETEIGVVEMGANHLKEIASLCLIAEPNYGLITNFGKAHLEGFGSLEGVKKGKSEVYDFIAANAGKVMVRQQDEEQLARSEKISRRLAPILKIENSQPLILQWDEAIFQTNLTGAYNVGNMELAAAVGLEMDISKEKIIKGLTDYAPKNNRSQIIEQKGHAIIMDAYNANPTSMRAALENLAGQSGHKTAILGDMFELGDYAEKEHQDIADLANQLKIDRVILIGDNFYKVSSTSLEKYKSFESFAESDLKLSEADKSVILIKGSRGMALEKVLKLI
ncbi:UDP-N-acetylmuramoyl-tripeptide--D-alanyl-D-alanine ligase [Nonlabens sp. Hel1_33_55]|uniref:UDP-N-acetylmuramoyl-tripeptide--D-alanyl-D- alanine ligase n=1 Tax=Nonlabens sp. Hel1_33_55 TaxID=1336802 RepID=UPI000875D67F|nr:UDP-N-acetylmuramoyl-tripeptide--D-alanyl-D-alanine ligase [Nonlabens sp. Hel1_33_55]SCY44687.1 UDP-N-acetylmuramoyl-tripeptide--D-alanyl-D-alanine ligase [Nonlabens sp. Hel1_33_55]